MSNTTTSPSATTFGEITKINLPNVTRFLESNLDIMNGQRLPSNGTQFDRDAIISIMRDIILRKEFVRQTAYDASTAEINECEVFISRIQTANATECNTALHALYHEFLSHF